MPDFCLAGHTCDVYLIDLALLGRLYFLVFLPDRLNINSFDFY